MAALPRGWDDDTYAELTRYVKDSSTVLSTPVLTFVELPDDHLKNDATHGMAPYLLALKQRMRKSTGMQLQCSPTHSLSYPLSLRQDIQRYFIFSRYVKV